MANNHRAHVYNTLEEFLASLIDTPHAQKWGKRRWRIHLDKNGNVPLIRKCSICSGKEQKQNIKHGIWKEPRPNKAERSEVAESLWEDEQDE